MAAWQEQTGSGVTAQDLNGALPLSSPVPLGQFNLLKPPLLLLQNEFVVVVDVIIIVAWQRRDPVGKPLARESIVSINLLSNSTESVTRPILRNQGSWCFEGCHGLRYFSHMCVAFEMYHTFIWFSPEFIDHGRRQNSLGTWPLNLGVTFLGMAPVE